MRAEPISLRPPQKHHRCLVYSSIGDNTNFQKWVPGRNFDLWLTYYGERDSTDHTDLCEFFVHRKGAKFPNFHYLYRQFGHIVQQYDYVMIADDDLIFSGADINKLFSIMAEYNLSLAQPAFDLCGKVSHRETKMHALSLLRYTSFVEVTCPTFKTPYLAEFMRNYDDMVIGWGVDWWFSDTVEKLDETKRTIAVVDWVTCINPLDRHKSNNREIDRYQSKEKRIEMWSDVKRQKALNITEVIHQYKAIRNYNPELLLKYIKMRTKWFFQRVGMLIEL